MVGVVRVGNVGGCDTDLNVLLTEECKHLHLDDVALLGRMYPGKPLDITMFVLDETTMKVKWVSTGQRIVVAFLLSIEGVVPHLTPEELAMLLSVRIQGLFMLLGRHLGCRELIPVFKAMIRKPSDGSSKEEFEAFDNAALMQSKACLERACHGGLTQREAVALLTVFGSVFQNLKDQKEVENLNAIIKQLQHILALLQDKYIADRASLVACATCDEGAMRVMCTILDHNIPEDQEGVTSLLNYVKKVVLTLPLPPAPKLEEEE